MAKTTRKPEPAAKPAAKYSLTLAIDPALARRFKSYCAFHGRDMAAVAADWFQSGMVGFRVGDSSGRSPAEPAAPEGQEAAAEGLRVAG